MKVLLDTNAFLSVALGEKLPRSARQVIERGNYEIVMSVITPWEIAIKSNESFGKRKNWGWATLDIEEAIAAMGARLLPITMRHIENIRRLPLHHGDPFDRMIIAQALEEQCPVMSSDQRLEAYKSSGLQIIWD